MFETMFYTAAQIASRHAKDYRFRLGAVVFNRGRIISEGWNQKKTHPLQFKYKAREQCIYLHAEIHALSRCKMPVQGYSIAVARLFKNGELGSSCPCSGCLAALQAFGIRNVYYYNGGIQCLNL